MAYLDQPYDFSCGNNSMTLRFAVKNPNIYAIHVDAPFVRNLDLSQGTLNAEVLILDHASKLTRVIWPRDTSSISRLVLSYADSIESLDLSALTSLDELIIHNCRNLKNIKGIPPKIRVIKIEETPIKSLDLTRFEHLKSKTTLPIEENDLVCEPRATDVQTVVQKQGYGISGRQNPLVTVSLLSHVDQNYDYLYQAEVSDTISDNKPTQLAMMQSAVPAWIKAEDESRRRLHEAIADKTQKIILLDATLAVAMSLPSLVSAIVYENKLTISELDSNHKILIVPSIALAKKLSQSKALENAEKVVILGRSSSLENLILDNEPPVIAIQYSDLQIEKMMFYPVAGQLRLTSEVANQILTGPISRAVQAYDRSHPPLNFEDRWNILCAPLNPNSLPAEPEQRPNTTPYQPYEARPRPGDEYKNLPKRDDENRDTFGQYGNSPNTGKHQDQYGKLPVNREGGSGDSVGQYENSPNHYEPLSLDQGEEELIRKPGSDDQYGELPVNREGGSGDSVGQYENSPNNYEKLSLDEDEELKRPKGEDEELSRKPGIEDQYGELPVNREDGSGDSVGQYEISPNNYEKLSLDEDEELKRPSHPELNEHAHLDARLSKLPSVSNLMAVGKLSTSSSFFAPSSSSAIKDENIKELLQAAKVVADSIQNLLSTIHEAFEELGSEKIDKKSLISYKQELKSAFSTSSNVLLERANLVSLLKEIRDELEREILVGRDAIEKSTKSAGAFSKPSNLGKKNARLMILNSIIRSLDSGNSMSVEEANVRIEDILKETQVLSRLDKNSIDLIKIHLTDKKLQLTK